MNELFNVRKADISDIKIIQKLIKNLAEYEKRPQDMTEQMKTCVIGFLKRK